MSLWGLFVIVGSIGILLSLGAAVLRPRDRISTSDRTEHAESQVQGADASVPILAARIDALEVEVDDLQRAIAQLREENEYLLQRIDGDPPTGEFS